MADTKRYLVVRPVHFVPGKTEQALQWLDETVAIRRRWGLIWQMAAQNIADRGEYVMMQLWESREAHGRWMASQDHADLVGPRQRLIAYDASRFYELATQGLCETLGAGQGAGDQGPGTRD